MTKTTFKKAQAKITLKSKLTASLEKEKVAKAKEKLAKQKEKERIKELKALPTVLVESPDAIFTDRLGNILNRGDMVCYPGQSELKIGVFVGLIEKTFDRFSGGSYSYYHGHYIDRTRTVTREQKLAIAVMDTKDKSRYTFIDFDLNKEPDGISLKKYVKVQRPEFCVGVPEVARCFSLIDNLKDGIFNGYEFEDDDC